VLACGELGNRGVRRLRDMIDRVEKLPERIANHIVHKLYYGHFFYQVFHQDYLLAEHEDIHAIEEDLLKLLDARGVEYPAEHNVGHLCAGDRAHLESPRLVLNRLSKTRAWSRDTATRVVPRQPSMARSRSAASGRIRNLFAD
jgi:hypothetical protein